MKVITELGQLNKGTQPYVVALGTFDGLHLGHQDVIQEAQREAKERGHLAAVFTFSNHPLSLIAPERVPATLFTQEQKHAWLERMGIDLLLDLPFDYTLAYTSKEEFLERLLRLGVSGIVVGENFTYGVGGVGNCSTLAVAANRYGFTLAVRPLVKLGGEVISSTLIRQLVLEGQVVAAAERLGRPYELTGTVAHGNERGRLLGFPTANLELADITVAVPPEGVYAVRVHVLGQEFQGMANIGKNPTFGDVLKPRLETNIFDFKQNIYGENITIEFVERIREQVKFKSVEQLKSQLEQDRVGCQKVFGSD